MDGPTESYLFNDFSLRLYISLYFFPSLHSITLHVSVQLKLWQSTGGGRAR